MSAGLADMRSTGMRLGAVREGPVRRRQVLVLGGREYATGEVSVLESTQADPNGVPGPMMRMPRAGLTTYMLRAELFDAGDLQIQPPVAVLWRLDPQSDEEALAYEVMGVADEVECEIRNIVDYQVEHLGYEGACRLTITGSK